MALTMEPIRTGGEQPEPLIGMLSKDMAPAYLVKSDAYKMVDPFIRLLDRRLREAGYDENNVNSTEVILPAKNHPNTYTTARYGLVKYEEVSASGLLCVVRSLSNPPQHDFAQVPRSHTINFIEPVNPEDYGVEPGFYVEKHYTPAGTQVLKSEHLHTIGQTYNEVIVPVGLMVAKAEAIIDTIAA